MRKKICMFCVVILLISIITTKVWAQSYPGVTQGTQQQSDSKYNEGDKGQPSTSIIESAISPDLKIETREDLENALKGCVEEGTLELSAVGKTETNLQYVEKVLQKVSEDTWQRWSNEDRETFEDFRLLLNSTHRGLSQNSNLQTTITAVEARENELERTADGNESAGPSGLLGNADASAAHTPDEIINEANNFLNQGNSNPTIDGGNLKQASSTLYNILLSCGIFLAVAIGLYLGVKFMVSTAEDKAKVKEALIPYIAGCVIIFSAFIIWRVAILLLGGIG